MHALQVGYNNNEQYWWAQNSYGPSFADQGVFKIAYGVALAANPNETFAITCNLASTYPANNIVRWRVQRTSTSVGGAPCFRYTGQSGDYLAGIAEHFGLDIVQLINRNRAMYNTTASAIDLTTPINGRRLLLCGITADMSKVAAIGMCGWV